MWFPSVCVFKNSQRRSVTNLYIRWQQVLFNASRDWRHPWVYFSNIVYQAVYLLCVTKVNCVISFLKTWVSVLWPHFLSASLGDYQTLFKGVTLFFLQKLSQTNTFKYHEPLHKSSFCPSWDQLESVMHADSQSTEAHMVWWTPPQCVKGMWNLCQLPETWLAYHVCELKWLRYHTGFIFEDAVLIYWGWLINSAGLIWHVLSWIIRCRCVSMSTVLHGGIKSEQQWKVHVYYFIHSSYYLYFEFVSCATL